MSNFDFSKLRVNCNRLGRLFVSNSYCITDKEEARLQELLLKERLGKLTEKELERVDALQEKKDESDPHIIGRGAQMYMLFIYCLRKYGKPPKLFTAGYIDPSCQNGIVKEPYSIELISRISGIQLYRNKLTLKNDYLTGIIDAWDSPNWEESKLVHEVKTTNNVCRFLLRKRYPLSKTNILQAQAYMALSDKDTCHIHFCLVDFPENVIEEQRQALFRYLCPDGNITERYLEEWDTMEGKFRFSNIPDKDRIFTCKVERDNDVIDKIYKKIRDCRSWITAYDKWQESSGTHQFVEPNKIRF